MRPSCALPSWRRSRIGSFRLIARGAGGEPGRVPVGLDVEDPDRARRSVLAVRL